MENKDRISNRKIDDFDLKIMRCIYCKENFKDHTVYETAEHEEDCLWRYYLVCLSCGHRNYLSVLTDHMECNCDAAGGGPDPAPG
nr:hypothetical protein [Candidatus Methanofastidiosa archaeon]HPR42211.1 hypothetical protein [Candidatus Methanofastidiosa archaeon]